MPDHWKVIYVNSRAEKKVAERLSRSNIECYVPLKREVRQWSDRKKLVEMPMISGYVFVRPLALQRDKVLQCAGVLQYVRYNQGDAIVRDMEIEALRSIEQKGYFVDGAFGVNLMIGDTATINYGPFKGLRGVVKSTSSGELYTLAIESIDYCLNLRIPKEKKKKVD